MTFQITEHDSIQVLEVFELIGEPENRLILDDVDAKIKSGRSNFVVDLSKITYMNSMGINFLISMMKRTREEGGDAVLINPSKQVNDLLEMTRLKPIFTLEKTLAEALDFFKQPNE